ncbi:MAG: alpha-xylosidase, partial [Opitutaceae bacterium]
DDPASDTLERQYMLGDSLLVAPVLSEAGVVDFYLPAGRWTHLITGEVREGGRWQRGTFGFLEMPLYVRPGRIVAIGSVDDRPDYAYSDGVTFRLYALGDGDEASASVPDMKGQLAARVSVGRKGRSVEATLEGSAKGWRLQLAGCKSVEAVEGGSAEGDPLGVVITANPGVRTLRARLPGA